jgi:hypothetical protein
VTAKKQAGERFMIAIHVGGKVQERECSKAVVPKQEETQRIGFAVCSDNTSFAGRQTLPAES